MKLAWLIFGLINGYFWLFDPGNSLWSFNAVVCVVCLLAVIAPTPAKKPAP